MWNKLRELDTLVAEKVLGYRVVRDVPLTISGDDGREFVSDFGPEATYRGAAVVSKHWDGKDSLDDEYMDKHGGIPEAWLEPVPACSTDHGETFVLKEALLDFKREEMGGATALSTLRDPYRNTWDVGISWSSGKSYSATHRYESVAWCMLALMVAGVEIPEIDDV